MYSQLYASILHPIWCYIFIIYYDYELKGAGIARSITFLLSYIFVWIAMKYYKIEHISKFNLKNSLKGWIPILKIAIPAGGTNYLKWCSIELLAVMVGNLPNKSALAGHSAFFSLSIFFSMFVKGL